MILLLSLLLAGIDPSVASSDFWVVEDPAPERLERVILPADRVEPAGGWRALVIHHVPPATSDDPETGGAAVRRDCHFIVGSGAGRFGDGVLAMSPRWFSGKKTGHLYRGGRVPTAVALCIVGDLDRKPPTSAQTKTLTALTRLLGARFEVPAQQVYTHREVDGRTTICPGRHFNKAKLLEDATLLPQESPRIVVEKKARRLTLYRGDAPILRFGVAAAAVRGLAETPTGSFTLCRRDTGGAFYRYLGLCEPNEQQGGKLGIHGGGDELHFDWTLGCVALADRDVAELFDAVAVGTPVEIIP